MSKNCYNCIFATEFRDHIREGEQVRCAKAEELFGTHLKGGKRWVDVQKSEKTGQVINSKCGEFQHLADNMDLVKILTEKEDKRIVRKPCPNCNGIGKLNVRVMAKTERVDCHRCKGLGKIPTEEGK